MVNYQNDMKPIYNYFIESSDYNGTELFTLVLFC